MLSCLILVHCANVKPSNIYLSKEASLRVMLSFSGMPFSHLLYTTVPSSPLYFQQSTESFKSIFNLYIIVRITFWVKLDFKMYCHRFNSIHVHQMIQINVSVSSIVPRVALHFLSSPLQLFSLFDLLSRHYPPLHLLSLP